MIATLMEHQIPKKLMDMIWYSMSLVMPLSKAAYSH